jgi:hypothetical protein
MTLTTAYPRARPVIELAGTPFYVDAQWLYLIEVGNPENKIDFQETRALKGEIALWYDTTTKNVYQGSDNHLPHEQVHIYHFHSLSAFDPVGAAALLDELNPEWRADFDPNLPVINIAGREFYVDEKFKCFYEVNNWWNVINFDAITSRNKVRGLFINLYIHNTAFPDELNLAFAAPTWPDNIIFVPLSKKKKGKKKAYRYFRRNKS